MEEELVLTLGAAPEDTDFDEILLKAFENASCTISDSPGAEVLLRSAKLALKVYVSPSIDTEVHRALKDIADEAAIKVFAENVRKLLLSSPYGPKAVLGVDPGIRTGCKLAVVDDSGKYVASGVMYLQSKTDQEKSAKILAEVVGTSAIRSCGSRQRHGRSRNRKLYPRSFKSGESGCPRGHG
ncbi:MAG: hypothetical protein IPO77_11175 [Acidobacteria bacterium]|nr:hypothetical protein [Acidobacteriota bacterium]